MKRVNLILILLTFLSGNLFAQCDAGFIPSLMYPEAGNTITFMYWGNLAPDDDWKYNIDYGNGSSLLNQDFPLTSNSLGSQLYSTAGTYTVEVTVWEPSVCTTSYSIDITVAASTPSCPVGSFSNVTLHGLCVEGMDHHTESVTLTNELLYPLDHIEWDMGNGTIINTTTTSVSYAGVYPDPGVYFVTARVFVIGGTGLCDEYAKGTLPFGADPGVVTDFVMLYVDDADPQFTMSPANPVVGDNVTFTYTGSYSLLPAYYYENDWAYQVQLTINSTTYPWTSLAPLSYGQSLYPLNNIAAGCYNYDFFIQDGYPAEPEVFCRQGESVYFCVDTIACDTCNSFRPYPGEKYWFSAWVQETHATQQASYDLASVDLNFVGPGTSTTLYPTGEIIDGWQRIAGEFTIPAGTLDLEISLNAGTSLTYFDDVRIHPYNGSMKSYVYDGETFWLVAELDDNNYATIYEYDAEGGLVRIKKETSGGIVTIQETRSNTIKVGTP